MSSATDAAQKMFLTTLVGVVLLGVALAEDQSEVSIPEEQPIGEVENVETRRMETPEVVLQLKYDRGELNRIYLAQFRKPEQGWSPSVSDRSNLCADLCHAGLGGTVCGSSCLQMIPVGLQSALHDGNSTEVEFGQPRVAVCPALCDNYMGSPLCQCQQNDKTMKKAVDWAAICDAFCMDGYALGGCPACEPSTPAPAMMSFRALNTVEGWAAWCDVQCRQGHGGAACNCDRTPF